MLTKKNNIHQKKYRLEDLDEIKINIRRQIQEKKEDVSYSAKRLVPKFPMAMLAALGSTAAAAATGVAVKTGKRTGIFAKWLNIGKGFILGFGVVKKLMKIFLKFK